MSSFSESGRLNQNQNNDNHHQQQQPRQEQQEGHSSNHNSNDHNHNNDDHNHNDHNDVDAAMMIHPDDEAASASAEASSSGNVGSVSGQRSASSDDAAEQPHYPQQQQQQQQQAQQQQQPEEQQPEGVVSSSSTLGGFGPSTTSQQGGASARESRMERRAVASAPAAANMMSAGGGSSSSSSNNGNDHLRSSSHAAASLGSHQHHHYPNNNSSSSNNNNSNNSSNHLGSIGSTGTAPGIGLAVFTWGRGEDGQLGLGDASDQDEPTYVDALRGVGVRQIACGSGHTVVLTSEGGQVYTWGRGDDGRLGHGENMWKYVPRVTQSLVGHTMVQVTCGSYHTAAVTAQGDLYTWGGGMYGKLGHGTEAGASTPKRVEAMVGLPVSQIACGSRHTAVVTAAGVVYTWGDCENGVAGHGETDGHQYAPRRLERLAQKCVSHISACGFHTAAVTDAGELYTWGEGKFGRLGHYHERNSHVPQLVESLLGKRPRQVSCGGFHTAVVTDDGLLFTFGGGEHGQLGHNDRVNKLRPTLVQALEGIFVSQITCGWSHSVALTAKGRVYTWGNGDHGKLGHGSGRKVSVPHMVEKLKDYRVVRVASYNEHTAALVEPLDPHHHHLLMMSPHGSHHALMMMAGHSSCSSSSSSSSSGSPLLPSSAEYSVVPVTLSYRQHFRALVNDEEYSDVTFLIENEPVHAHRAILAQRCEPFAAMFRSGMRESVERVIAIPNVRKKVFLLLLEYLYTDTLVTTTTAPSSNGGGGGGFGIEMDCCVELYICADLYHLDRLRDLCFATIRRYLTADNAGPLLQTASDLHCHVLKDWIMTFVVEQFDKVSKTQGIQHVSHALLLEILSRR